MNVIARLKTEFVSRFAVVPMALLLIIFSGPSCVSVNIGPGKIQKSKGVSYASPTGTFRSIANERADSAWNNPATGSTIAFQSNCGDAADLELESIAQDLFTGFEQSKILRNERIPFDGREGLEREVEGKVDGVITRVRAIIYKKNKCTYVLTHVALAAALVADNSRKAAVNGDSAQFERFATSFKAP